MFSRRRLVAISAGAIGLGVLLVALTLVGGPTSLRAVGDNTVTIVDNDIHSGKDTSIGIGTDGFPRDQLPAFG